MATVNWDPGYRKTLTILSGQTVSDVLDLAGLGTRHIYMITFRSPVTLPETVTVEVSEDVAGTFEPYQSGDVDVTLPAGEASPVTEMNTRALRLVAGTAVGANRVFVLQGNTRR